MCVCVGGGGGGGWGGDVFFESFLCFGHLYFRLSFSFCLPVYLFIPCFPSVIFLCIARLSSNEKIEL